MDINNLKAALECCNERRCKECPYNIENGEGCTESRNKDIIEMLEKMEKRIFQLENYGNKTVLEMPAKKYVEQDCVLTIFGVTALSIDEYEMYKDFIPYINKSWWLRSSGGYTDMAAYVDFNGIIRSSDVEEGKYIVVRPVLAISSKASGLEVGDKFHFRDMEWTVIAEDFAICHSHIGESVFNIDASARNANKYEESVLKKRLENWLYEIKEN